MIGIGIPPLLTIGYPQLVLVALIVLLLFGGKKIPELMKGIGKGVKSFKDGVKGIDSDEEDGADKSDNGK